MPNRTPIGSCVAGQVGGVPALGPKAPPGTDATHQVRHTRQATTPLRSLCAARSAPYSTKGASPVSVTSAKTIGWSETRLTRPPSMRT